MAGWPCLIGNGLIADAHLPCGGNRFGSVFDQHGQEEGGYLYFLRRATGVSSLNLGPPVHQPSREFVSAFGPVMSRDFGRIAPRWRDFLSPRPGATHSTVSFAANFRGDWQ